MSCNTQKALVDGGLTVKAIRESDWKKAKPVKPTMEKIDLRKETKMENLFWMPMMKSNMRLMMMGQNR